MTVALLCPTRARPEQCKRMIKSAAITSTDKVLVYLAVSKNEFDIYKNTLSLYKNDKVEVLMVTMPDNLHTAQKWNSLAELAMNKNPDYLMLGADDMVFETPCWNEALTETKPHVYALQDSRDENGVPHPIMSRAWVDAMGWFVPPIFTHWMIDSWSVEIAKANNCFTHLREYSLLHDKCNDRGEPDETHSRIRNFGWHSRDMWVAEKSADILEMYKERLAKCLKN